MLERLEILIGNENINKIKNKTVLIIGLGGVGSYVVEALVRSGIGHIIIVDNDCINPSNLNRQLMTNINNIGELKTDAIEERMKNINPNCFIEKLTQFITPDNIAILFDYNFDYLVDACDTVSTKKEIIRYCVKKRIKFIESMGMGNRLSTNNIVITDIRKTNNDPLARIIRKMVKDERIREKITVVTSLEPPIKTNNKTLGSSSFVPAIGGLMAASWVINDIIKGESNEKV